MKKKILGIFLILSVVILVLISTALALNPEDIDLKIFSLYSEYRTEQDIRFHVNFIVDGTYFPSCYIYPEGTVRENCVYISSRYEWEDEGTSCSIVPTSYGKSFECNMVAPKISGNYEIRVSYSFPYKPDGRLYGGERRFKIAVYECGDGICTSDAENYDNCCTDCGAPLGELMVCESNKLVSSCGDGICQANYGENQQNCCGDCGPPEDRPLQKCVNNKVVHSCGDGICQANYGENKRICCTDCGVGLMRKCIDGVSQLNNARVMGIIVSLILLITIIILFFRKKINLTLKNKKNKRFKAL